MAGDPKTDVKIADFLAYQGGPFFELQERIGLLRRSALNARRRALLYSP